MPGHDRKAIRIYPTWHQAPGPPPARAHTFAAFAAYLRQRAADDPHLRVTGLHREITALGYAGSYSRFTHELRSHCISAACDACKPWQPVTPARQQRPTLLPARVAPLAGETISSYLSRVAAASHLPAKAITGCLPPWFAARTTACDDLAGAGLRRPGDAGPLAALTGITETALRHALPALAGTHDGGRPPVRAVIACRRCTARTGHRAPIPVHLPAHQRTCIRHRVWLGLAIQIDLTAAPDITRACHHASRLARQYGVTRLVLAETTARQRTAATRRSPDARRTASVLASSNPGPDPGHPDMTEAAAYPETIKMAAAILRNPGRTSAGPQ